MPAWSYHRHQGRQFGAPLAATAVSAAAAWLSSLWVSSPASPSPGLRGARLWVPVLLTAATVASAGAAAAAVLEARGGQTSSHAWWKPARSCQRKVWVSLFGSVQERAPPVLRRSQSAWERTFAPVVSY